MCSKLHEQEGGELSPTHRTAFIRDRFGSAFLLLISIGRP